jgi:hypothetical protein
VGPGSKLRCEARRRDAGADRLHEAQDGTLEPNEDADHVRQVFRRRARGDSWTSLAAYLDSAGGQAGVQRAQGRLRAVGWREVGAHVCREAGQVPAYLGESARAST